MRPATFDNDNNQWVQIIPQREYYSIQDASHILDMGTTQIYGSIKRGTIVAYKVDGVVRIKHDDMIEYINKRGAVSSPRGIIELIVPLPTSRAPTAGAQQDLTTLPAQVAPVGGLNLDDLDLGAPEPSELNDPADPDGAPSVSPDLITSLD